MLPWGCCTNSSVLISLLNHRKRPADATPDFDSAMGNIFEIMMNSSRDFLHKSSVNSGSTDDREFEFAELICECMVSLGSTNLMCITSNTSNLSYYLQQVNFFVLEYYPSDAVEACK